MRFIQHSLKVPESRDENLEKLFKKPIGWGHAWTFHYKSQGRIWVVEDESNKENLLSEYADCGAKLTPDDVYTRRQIYFLLSAIASSKAKMLRLLATNA
jgi:hypothetical protein